MTSYNINTTLCYITLIFFLFSCKNESPTVAQKETQEFIHPAQNQRKKEHYSTTQARKGAGKILSEADKKRADLNTGGLIWTTFEEIAKNGSNNSKKKYLVDVYTDWCGWCKVMDKKTFTDPEIQSFLRENFHIVKFNAEQMATVSFKNEKFKWEKKGKRGVNQLATKLLGSKMSYPTIVYLDEELNPLTASPGYKKPAQLMKELEAIIKM